MRHPARLLLGLVSLGVALPALADDAKKVPVLRKWTGKLADEKLLKQSPTTDVIADKKVFETLWNAWRPQEPVPAVDFDKELVLVATAAGPTRSRSSRRWTTRAT
jgi:hypothetical protein